jgi:hypothetical protein
MILLKNLKSLIRILSTRQVGHTTLMQKGTNSYDKPFAIISIDKTSATELTKGSEFAEAVSIQNLDSLLGKNLPIAIENYTLTTVLRDSLYTIEKLTEHNDLKQEIISELTTLVEQYQIRSHEIESLSLDMLTCPWWNFGKLIMLEKRMHKMILAYNQDPKLIKAFDKLTKIAKSGKLIK